jgi:hypothetical protein
MRLGVRPMITAQRSYGSRAIKKGKAPIEQQVAKLFEEMIMAVKFKENPTVDLDGSFHGIEHRDI